MGEELPFEMMPTSEGEVVLAFRTALTYEHAAEIWEKLSGLFRDKKILIPAP